MGTAYKTGCFDTPAAALAAACSADFPTFTPDGAGGLNTVQCVPGSDDASLLLTTTTAAASTSTTAVAIALGSCDPLSDFVDVTDLWGLLVLACVLVFVVKQFIYRNVTGNQ